MSTSDETAVSPAEDASLPLARGAVAGAAAWLSGYLVAYVWNAETVREALQGIGFVSRLLGGDAVPAWKGVAWLYLNAHFVATEIPTVTGGTRTTNFVTADGGGSPALFALAPVILLVAGALVVRTLGAHDPTTPGDGDSLAGAKVGATTTLGYLPLTAGTAVLSAHAIGDTDAAIAPDLVTAILLAGVACPVVFGALGGVVASFAE